MKRLRLTAFVIVGFALVYRLAILAGSPKPPAQLRMVRSGVERGRPVVFFRVEAETNRFLIITPQVQKLEEGRIEELLVKGTNGAFAPASDFFGTGDQGPVGDEAESRKEFGVVEATGRGDYCGFELVPKAWGVFEIVDGNCSEEPVRSSSCSRVEDDLHP
jgi:hypothetical protein